jgi:hypothetical protein
MCDERERVGDITIPEMSRNGHDDAEEVRVLGGRAEVGSEINSRG